MCAHTLEKNVYCVNTMNGHTMGFFTMGEEEKWHTKDVTPSMERHIFGTHVDIEYTLMSVDKDLNPAYIHSRKSDHIPYMELVVNGETFEIKSEELASDKDVNAIKGEINGKGFYFTHTNNCKKNVDLGEVKTTAVNTVIFDDGTSYEF